MGIGLISLSNATMDSVLELLTSFGDSLHPETGRTRETYCSDAQFDGDVFWSKLDALYARNNPSFNDPQLPLRHYQLWHHQHQPAATTRRPAQAPSPAPAPGGDTAAARVTRRSARRQSAAPAAAPLSPTAPMSPAAPMPAAAPLSPVAPDSVERGGPSTPIALGRSPDPDRGSPARYNSPNRRRDRRRR
jgi:hypothetical protein